VITPDHVTSKEPYDSLAKQKYLMRKQTYKA